MTDNIDHAAPDGDEQVCEWCYEAARGTAFWQGSDTRRLSCGAHGFDFLAAGFRRSAHDAEVAAEALEEAARVAERYTPGYSKHPDDPVIERTKRAIAEQIRKAAEQ